MVSWLYALAVGCYHLGIRVAALFSGKARLWVEGRKGWQAALRQWRSQPANQSAPVLWMHCSSLGEFEQGRPVLEGLRRALPGHRIVLTFYSPSGYERQRNYAGADYVAYLPADSPANARRWQEALAPELAVFVKYDFWLFHLQALFRRGTPVFLVAAHFRPRQVFFRPWGGLFRRTLRRFRWVFVQQDSDVALLQSIGVDRVTYTGDPRVDRVAEVVETGDDFPIIEAFAGRNKLLIAGSTWAPDEDLLLQWASSGHMPPGWKLLIAPHQVEEEHIRQLSAKITLPWVSYLSTSPADTRDARIMVLNTIGVLSRAYRYGALAYIGGGFGAGIHNTLEPVAHGLPVVFGPRHHKFPEAEALIASGGGFCVTGPAEFGAVFEKLHTGSALSEASAAARGYINRNRGAAERTVGGIIRNRLPD
jgi:3-deoxy-D-manno-octulosonic-acid transferase